jgi:hypothetical protein
MPILVDAGVKGGRDSILLSKFSTEFPPSFHPIIHLVHPNFHLYRVISWVKAKREGIIGERKMVFKRANKIGRKGGD